MRKGERKQRASSEQAEDRKDPRVPVQCNPTNCPILVDYRGYTLAIMELIPGAVGLSRATVDGKRCVALKKTRDDAYSLYNALLNFNHTNILKSIGIWEDPQCHDEAYIVFRGVDGTIAQLGGQTIFEEGDPRNGFSEQGFQIFRDIFSAIDHVNSRYASEGTSSATHTQAELLQIFLDPANIYYKMVDGEPLVLLGNMTKCHQEQTAAGLREAHWKDIGACLHYFLASGNEASSNEASMELRELARFLTNEIVSLDDLLWQPGLWNGNTKMEFIREIHFMIDKDRDREKKEAYRQTEKGKQLVMQPPLMLLPLMHMFPKQKDENGFLLERRENNLLHSVLFLRNTFVAHYDENYEGFLGKKEEIGTTKGQAERYIQHMKNDYMINLARTIKELGWFESSPILRDKTNYMEAFYKMRISEQKAKSKSKR